MKKPLSIAVIVAALLLLFSGCKKQSEDVSFTPISEYYPLEVGKYVTYSLDSLVYNNFGEDFTPIIVSYQVKHLVDAQITDNLGRPSYRIVRYIRKNESGPWLPDNTFMATNTGNSVEFTENNFRYIKLRQPLKDEYSWKGNKFIDTYLYSGANQVKYLDDWDYAYDSLNTPLNLGSFLMDSTLKVAQRDEIIGNPDDLNSYSEKNYSSERYAKGIGLVYRNFFHQEYQPPINDKPGHIADGSYGVILTMIDHN